MKRFLISILSVLLCVTSAPSYGRESLDEHAENTDHLYRMGVGAKDGAFTATSTSMLGWGIALFVAIALLATAIHHSGGKKKASLVPSST